MAEARHRNSIRKAPNLQGSSRFEFPKKPAVEEMSRLLHLREIEQRFGLSEYHVYRAVHEGRLHPLQRDGRGRTYYAEWEVQALVNTAYPNRFKAAA
jgi:predicted DNA-binding transcriptional regulator AlpA